MDEQTTAATEVVGAGESELQAIHQAKINAVVSHLWRASAPFQRTGTCLTEAEWRISLERLYEAIATGNPTFGGWPAPECVAAEAEKAAQIQTGDVVTAVIE